MTERKVERLKTSTWTVERTATIDIVQFEKSGLLITRYHVEVSDGDRKPFLTKWFNDPVQADDFIESVRSGFSTRGKRK